MLGLAAAELSLRLLFPDLAGPGPRNFYVVDESGGFRLAPAQQAVIRHPDYRYEVRTNALGLRDRDLGPKRQNEWRLLVLGDSFTFGQGIAEPNTYVSRLEAALAGKGYDGVEVINAGVPGYGTVHAESLLTFLVDRVEPDAVLLAFFPGNDFSDNVGLNRYELIDGYLVMVSRHGTRIALAEQLRIPPRAKLWLRRNVYSYTVLMSAWTVFLVGSGLAETSESLGLYCEDAEADWNDRFGDTAASLQRLQTQCGERDLPFAVVVIPDAPVFPLVRERSGCHIHRPGTLLERVAVQADFPILDLTDAFAGRQDLYFPTDRHWNSAGHALAAGILARELTQGDLRILLPDANTFSQA